ncbi:hypothetical protein NKR19_g4785 [Coniochaeta hoffmannii]|uniref:WW domain-containing protein n=1 Tax=Coniochaeta hoffmannii TaxID=91930 RepID=A0AA38VU99_9PEZI|nr:hypothetical protein NKR19_g4785 [Coniochaeta hoffmannii]
MSFFKKLSNELDGVMPGSRNREEEGYTGRGDVYPLQQADGEPYSSLPYQAPPPKEQRPAPVYSPPSDKPPIPAGWVPQWDEHYQRWFYHDTTTGRSQWEAPGYILPRPLMPGEEGDYRDGAGGYHAYAGGTEHSDKQKSGHGGILLGAAGGLAAGALLSNALHDDADDNYRSYPQGPPVQAPAYADSVGSSDRESLEEARQEYAEALDDARSSSASSDDRERLEEAREEYYSEEEEAYGSD